MATGNIQGKVTITGGAQAQEQLRRLKRESGELGTQIDTFKERAILAVGGAAAFGAAMKAMQVAAQVAAAAIRVATEAARQMFELAERSGAVGDVAAAFERIGSPELLTRLRAVTGGMVSDMRLMQEFNQAMRAGILQPDEIVEAFDLVTLAARQMGEDVDSAVRGLGDSLSRGTLRSLAPLGINVAAIQDRVRDMGLEMQSAEGRAAGLRLAMDALSEALEGQTSEARTAGDGIAQMRVSIENARDAMALAFGSSEEMTRSISDLASAVTVATPIVRHWTQVWSVLVVRAMRDAQAAIIVTTANVERLTAVMARAASVAAMLPGPFAAIADLALDAARAIDEQTQAMAGLGAEGRQLALETARLAAAERASAAARREARPEAPTRARRGGGAASAAEYLPHAAGMELMLEEMLERTTAGIERRRGEMLALLKATEDIATAQRAADEQLRRDAEAVARSLEEQLELREQLLMTSRWMAEAAHEEAESTRQKAEAEQRALNARITGTADTAAQAMGLLGQVMQQVIDYQEAQGKSVETLKKIQGGFLVAYNVVLAATEIAKAIGSYPDPFGIAAHALSAAAHITAASIAAAQLGGSAPAGAGAAAPSATFTPAAPAPEPGGRGRSEGVTIHQQYLLSETEAGMARVMERSQYQRRRQFRADRSAAVRYAS